VTLADGRRWVDAHFGAAMRWVIALPSAAGSFVTRAGQEAELPRQPATPLRALSFRPARSSARGSLERTLRDELFAAPYTQDYYRGFVDSRGLASVDWTTPARALPLAVDDPSRGSAAPARATAITTDTPRAERSKVPSLVLMVAGGAALITGGVTAALALDARSDFEDTTQMKRASVLSTRYSTFGTATWVALSTGLASGLAAWALWPAASQSETVAAR
jgi:hypothetical protein